MFSRGLAFFALLLTTATIAGAEHPRGLIVVTDIRDSEVAKRIGGEIVEVRELLKSEGEKSLQDYSSCNAWVKRLHDFDLYLTRHRANCPYECFWRERLTTANPRGRVIQLSDARPTKINRFEPTALELTQVYLALVSAFPEHKVTFQENLIAELQRIEMLSHRNSQLVFGKSPTP